MAALYRGNGGFAVAGEHGDEAGDFFGFHCGAIDEDGVFGLNERGSGAFAVAAITLMDFVESAGEIDCVTFLLMLTPAALGADFGRRSEKNLQLGVGKDYCADVASLHNDAARFASTALFCDEDVANAGIHGDFRGGLRNFGGANCGGDVFAVEEHSLSAVNSAQVNSGVASERYEIVSR